MITYKDEDLKYIYGNKEEFLNNYISEEHKNIKVLDYKILLKEENQRVSDHYFIYNEIEWRK